MNMARNGWNTEWTETGVTLSRRRPVVWDVAAETLLPAAPAGRVAHQVRQDVWRALRRVRGFAPAVAVTVTERDAASGAASGAESAGLRVRAGGAVAGRVPPDTAARIAAVLEDRANRARWIAFARRGTGGTGGTGGHTSTEEDR